MLPATDERDVERAGEDAAYLRVIELLRVGDSVQARDAAREYLQRYPDGFRRQELESLARTTN